MFNLFFGEGSPTKNKLQKKIGYQLILTSPLEDNPGEHKQMAELRRSYGLHLPCCPRSHAPSSAWCVTSWSCGSLSAAIFFLALLLSDEGPKRWTMFVVTLVLATMLCHPKNVSTWIGKLLLFPDTHFAPNAVTVAVETASK